MVDGYALIGGNDKKCLTIAYAFNYNSQLIGSLAQPVEQRTFNPLVEGSNPSRPTKFKTDRKLCLRSVLFYL